MENAAVNEAREELEWQFAADDLEAVESWLLEHPAVSRTETQEISDTYLDTADWTLYKAGYALRLRKSGNRAEVTMKSLSAGAGDGLRRRREISEPLPGWNLTSLRRASGTVGERLRALGVRRAVQPIFEIHTRRQAFDLTLGGGPSGEVALDNSAVSVPAAEDEQPAVLRRVEVEVESGFAEDFGEFVESLRAGCGLEEVPGSKFAAGLAASGLEPGGAPEKGPIKAKRSVPAAEFAFAVLRRQYELFRYHEPGSRLGEDPEELHDMRVASRRMRAALRLFQEVLPEKAGELRQELRWVASALGEVRDLDVQLDSLERWRSGLAGEKDAAALDGLKDALEKKRAKNREKMLRTLNSSRYAELVENLEAMLEEGPPDGGGRPLRAVAPGIVESSYRRMRKAGDRISEGSPPEDYHEVRKKARRLRYAVEFLRGVYGKPADAWIQTLKTLQDVLGDHQDTAVARENLRELALSSATAHGPELSPHTVFVMGGIYRDYAEREAALRREFPKTYSRVKGNRRKKFQKKLDKNRGAG